ncbi:MAG: 2,3-bisphosphoglycerate-independent phosphoglycerate mutase [Candidatus Gastranaerophilales bacterium]|nr:2,3-bisphosphoglycerate-independent phosphoglycerate mutase [Candidatus Gastranaerophilales bacterium]
MNNKKVLLTILDGWGCGSDSPKNAIKEANTPNFDKIKATSPFTKIRGDGEYVGLPDGQMGNSEVGHLNMGAGRIVYQELTRINKSIDDKDFFENKEFLNAIKHAKDNDSSLHIMGLVSNGGVHSSMKHIFALIDLAKMHNLEKFYVHAFLDGRDTPPQSAYEFVQEVENKLKENNFPALATVSGRYYAMDRDKRWDRVEKAYNCLLLGEGNIADDAVSGIKASYENGVNDEFVLPTVCNKNSRLNDNDSIIFFNFRPDRAREITNALNFKNFNGFERKKVLNDIYYVCMTQYDETFGLPIAFPPQKLTNILGEIFDKHNIRQFRTAETEKYAHITFFFNGGIEESFKTETRSLVNSPKVATYDLQPEMSAYEVADKVIEALNSNKYQFILVNFANPDMVGHTGIMSAAVKAIEAVDECLGKILVAVNKNDFTMILTADHGNAECMEDPQTHKAFTAHTTNPVPFAIINAKEDIQLRETGALCDIAPTILDIMEIKQPAEMTGTSMIKK